VIKYYKCTDMSSVHVGISKEESFVPTPPLVEEILETDTIELVLLFLLCISFLSCFYRTICRSTQGTQQDECHKGE
jgi:hypothetical protein